MITLENDKLIFSFPEVHPCARVSIHLQRTLRIPDDDKTYPLPPGLGRFPLKHVDDFRNRVPDNWTEHGGVMFPMYQSEAMWICFDGAYDRKRRVSYPFAVKIATGKINALSGETWKQGLNRDPQDYCVVPDQPWLDGYCVEKGTIRQFVAMPLGAGYTAEEQVTGAVEHGGLQILAYPMKRAVYEELFPERDDEEMQRTHYCLSDASVRSASAEMGLAPGGKMEQEIYEDDYRLSDWDLDHGSRCFVHICNSMVWRQVTGREPPTVPPTSKEYNDCGLPWFDYYDDQKAALQGAGVLKTLKSVATLGNEKGDVPLPENQSVDPDRVLQLRAGMEPGQVREWH